MYSTRRVSQMSDGDGESTDWSCLFFFARRECQMPTAVFIDAGYLDKITYYDHANARAARPQGALIPCSDN